MSDKSTTGPLPLMKTMADAVALCEREKDNYYVTAFMLQAWLGMLSLDAAAEYAEKKEPRQRRMQTGQAWSRYLKLFGRARDGELPHILDGLQRFAGHDDMQSEMLRQAAAPLWMELEESEDYFGPKTQLEGLAPALITHLMKRRIARWCEWLDAVNHSMTHTLWHLSPASFDPDADKRELAALGINQRCFADLSEPSKEWWHWHHGEAAQRFKDSPKWPTVGQAMAAKETRHWNYPEVDQAVINCWPLVIRHNWTYRDLMVVVGQMVPSPARYPLEREQDLAAYCGNVLGLRKPPGPAGRSSADGRPPGHQIALRHLPKANSGGS